MDITKVKQSKTFGNVICKERTQYGSRVKFAFVILLLFRCFRFDRKCFCFEKTVDAQDGSKVTEDVN